MPELPEVELTRRHLDDVMVGRVLTGVTVSHPRTARQNSSTEEVVTRLTGRRIMAVSRSGKFIHAPLDDGQVLVAHLGMSGRFTVNGSEERHTHFTAVLDNGDVVRFIDPRTFGFIAVFEPDEAEMSGLGRLGRDSLTDLPTVEELAKTLVNRTAPIKGLLLDQRIMSGLGNIYADEALHRALIHPARPGGDLDHREIEALLEAIRGVLESAIANGGTSLDDLAYLLPDGRAGENLDRLLVYGRSGEPCVECGTPIERMVIRGRSSHFCPACQGRR